MRKEAYSPVYQEQFVRTSYVALSFRSCGEDEALKQLYHAIQSVGATRFLLITVFTSNSNCSAKVDNETGKAFAASAENFWQNTKVVCGCFTKITQVSEAAVCIYPNSTVADESRHAGLNVYLPVYASNVGNRKFKILQGQHRIFSFNGFYSHAKG